MGLRVTTRQFIPRESTRKYVIRYLTVYPNRTTQLLLMVGILEAIGYVDANVSFSSDNWFGWQPPDAAQCLPDQRLIFRNT